jgi:hypothetical protein
LCIYMTPVPAQADQSSHSPLLPIYLLLDATTATTAISITL